jgi:GTP cyclohydrolase I
LDRVEVLRARKRVGPRLDRARVAGCVRALLEAIGEDPDRQGLARTPERVADMYQEIFAGLGAEAVAELDVLFDAGHDEMIMVRDIAFASMCEHHLVPFLGRAHIAYIPNKQGQITGLSKLARLVDVYARRLQVQERMTNQIATIIMEKLDALGVAVVIEAEHLCMRMRGVEKQNSYVITSSLLGAFRTRQDTRSEFMNLIRHRV